MAIIFKRRGEVVFDAPTIQAKGVRHLLGQIWPKKTVVLAINP